MGNQEEQSGQGSGYYPINLTTSKPAGQISVDPDLIIGAFVDVWAEDSNGNQIVEAKRGDRIVIACEYNASVSGIFVATWKLTVTAIEPGQPLSTAWKNANAATIINNRTPHFTVKLTDYSGGSLYMPDRALNLRLTLWGRGDIAQAFPPLESW